MVDGPDIACLLDSERLPVAVVSAAPVELPARRSHNDLRDRFRGCLLGAAIGDALGRAGEGRPFEATVARYGGPLRDYQPWREWTSGPTGTITDDTQMSLCVARALIKAGHRSFDDLMEVMAREFVDWSRSPDNDRAAGHTCMTGCRNPESGMSWRHAGVSESKGCGSAMRTAPIGLYYCDHETALTEVARASSLPTQGHPTSLAAAAATALLVCWALWGDEPLEYPRRLTEAMTDTNGGVGVAAFAEQVPSLLNEPPEIVLCHGSLGEAWTGDEAVASALYCFCRSPADYRQTVLTGADTVGDSASIACIVGAISGAYNGLRAIPENWRSTVENAQYLCEIAADLYGARRQRRE